MNGTPPRTVLAWVSLGVSAALILPAPLWMPAGYSALTHSISESAAQGMPHAVLARAGLALLGVGAVLTALAGHRLPKASVACLLVFGLAMLAMLMGAPGPGAAQRVMFLLASLWPAREAAPDPAHAATG
jgi:hypothetical protein